MVSLLSPPAPIVYCIPTCFIYEKKVTALAVWPRWNTSSAFLSDRCTDHYYRSTFIARFMADTAISGFSYTYSRYFSIHLYYNIQIADSLFHKSQKLNKKKKKRENNDLLQINVYTECITMFRRMEYISGIQYFENKNCFEKFKIAIL